MMLLRTWSSARAASRRWLAAVRGTAGRLSAAAVVLALLLVGGAGCLASDPSDADLPAQQSTVTARAEASSRLPSTDVPAVAADHAATRVHQVEDRSVPEVAALRRTAFTVEELLQDGLQMAGASPVHLAIRGTPTADSVRCTWRGVVRTAKQREGAIRFWLQLESTEAIPNVATLELLFNAVLNTLNPDYRETAKAAFRAIARGGESMDFLFLTCFADYAVSHFLLGTGTTPATVTVAYDSVDEAASYDLYVREHDSRTYGSDPLQTRGAYEAGLQAQVVAAEKALSDEIGGREAVVFLAPMGAHNAIGFEAWQVVAQWAVVTDDEGVVQAIRDDTPEGDPEHTQTLANLTTRITTAAASDDFATTRVTTVGGLQPYYRTTLLAYADITPGDGATTTFTPAQPPAAPTCTNGTAITNPADNRELVKDCQTLLAAKDTLRGTAALNWATGTALSSWTGVSTGGTPTRVTGLSLPSKSMTGTIPPQIGHLFALTTLNLKTNSLTGAIPAELGWLDDLTELRLSGNTLTGCIPLNLRSVTTNDLASLNLPYCEPPAPANLRAGTPGETTLAVLWDALTNANTYQVEVWESEGRRWRVDADAVTGTTHSITDLNCETAYDVRVRAHGSGTGYAAAWGLPSAPLTATTGACTPPVFDPASYEFSVVENVEVGTPVGTVAATDDGGAPVTYAISEGNDDGTFAIDATSGAITVAGALDRETTASYMLTVGATDPVGGIGTAPVTITVTDFVMDYDADDDGLIEVASLAQLNAIRWDLDGDGVASEAGHAAAFPDAGSDMGCPAAGCTGYELTADLDFDTDGSGEADAGDTYWNDGDGWEPLGDGTTSFTATFHGNGHTMTNLLIDRDTTNQVGLFGQTGTAGVVRNVGLVDVDVTGRYEVGGLVGRHHGTITTSYVTGQVASPEDDVGGLTGVNDGQIRVSYATATVTGDGHVGGLASFIGGGGARIRASYASGPVTGGNRVGGLVAAHLGSIRTSYARGAVTGTSNTGGLAGASFGRAVASYWDTTTSGQTTSASGTGQTTAELQMPTGYTGIYATWNVDLDGDGTADDVWDFGTASEYPVLKVDFDGDGTASWQEFGDQRPVVNHAPTFTDGDVTERMVAENTAAGEPIGDPVAATDEDSDDTLAYRLYGDAAASFGLDTGTGQLQTLAALDYEMQMEYAVTVEVSDGAGGTATIEVTIEITDVLDTPPPTPANLAATPAATSVALTWDALAGAVKYQVDYRASGATAWMTAAAEVTTASYTVADLTCHNAYEVQVLAYGDGTAHTAAWGAPTAALPVTTTVCPPPTFGAESYSFTVSERAAVDDPVDTVTATTTGTGPVGYAITDGNDDGTFAIGATSGQLSVAGEVGAVGTAYALTVKASAGGSSATVTVTVTAVLTAPPAPSNLAATPAATSVALTWDALAGAAKYRVDYREPGTESWMLVADDVTAATHTVPGLTCHSAYEVQVRAYGDGTAHTAAWGAPTAALPVTTTVCPPPTFGAESYSFTVSESAAVDDPVDTVSATTTGAGPVGYAITDGNDDGRFAIGATTGQLSVAGAVGAVGTAHALTVQASAGGSSATVTVTITVTPAVLMAPPAPSNLAATAGVTSVALTWDALAGAAKYQVDYRASGATEWMTAAAEVTTASYTVADLTCHSPYEVQVLAYGDGAAHTAAWGEATAALPVTTTVCPPPTFDPASYNFTLTDGAAVDDPVGSVTATTTGAGPVSYAITDGNDDGRFAIGATTGQLSVAGAVEAVGTAYALTVQASAGGSSAEVTVTITVTPAVLMAPPPPTNLAATPAATSVALTWDAVAGAAKYEVEVLPPNHKHWTSDAADVTGTSHTVADLTCGTPHQFRVRAYGDGVRHLAAWGEATAELPATTTACPPTFGEASYAFTVGRDDGTGTAVGTVTATPAGEGALSYAITSGNEAGAFAIGSSSGEVTVAGSLEAGEHALTVSVTEADGGTATVGVSITVTLPALTASFEGDPTSEPAADTFLFEVWFSETPHPDFSYTTLRDHAFTVTGGQLVNVRRLEPPGNISWEIEVRPDDSGDVVVVLPATTDCNADGAVCTGDGRMMSNRSELTVPWPLPTEG